MVTLGIRHECKDEETDSDIREYSLFMGWGGRVAPEFLITLANHLIYAKDFLRVPFLPKDSDNIDVLKFFAPLRDASENFRH